jgi:hypothetical protein
VADTAACTTRDYLQTIEDLTRTIDRLMDARDLLLGFASGMTEQASPIKLTGVAPDGRVHTDEALFFDARGGSA